MSFLEYLPILKNVFTQVQKNNKENPTEKTAPKEVFDRVHKKIEDVDFNHANKNDQAALIEMLRKKIEEAQRENEATDEEETADAQIFDQLNKRMNDVFDSDVNDVAAGRVYRGSTPSHNTSKNDDRYSAPPERSSDYQNSMPQSTKPMPGSSAMIQSGGGSVALRVSPDIGAGKLKDRLPHQAQVYVLETTQTNPVHIDGKVSGWCKIDHNGIQGWILDKYLDG